MSHKFYDTKHLTLDQRREILCRAKEKCDRWWVDVLDGTSVYRQKVDMPFEEIMQKFDRRCLFRIIHRNVGKENYLEIGFCTMGGIDYFLWIVLDIKHIDEFTK